MPTLLSVDYDFLVPHGIYEKSIYLPAVKDDMPGLMVYDWQQHEGRNPILDQVVWETRCRNFKRWGLDIRAITESKLTPEDFITNLSCMVGGASVPTWYADSHAWGAIMARDYSATYKEPFSVVNFDAHHDLGYMGAGYDSEISTLTVDDVDCSNWALHALQQGQIENYTLVYPDWLGLKEMPKSRLKELQKEFPGKISVMTWSEWLHTDEIDDLEAAFFCRSSAWVPPWCDSGFQTMLDEWGFSDCLDCQFGQMCSPYDACKPREWNWADVERMAAEMEEQTQALLTGALKMGKLPDSE